LKTIECFEEACGVLIDSLKANGYHVIGVEPYHFLPDKGKFVHAFLKTSHPEHGKEWMYIKYSQMFYETFGKEFPDTLAGYGESLNQEVYSYLCKWQTPRLLFFAHPNAFYMVEFKTFSHYCHKHATIRRQKKAGEITVSIDAKYLRRLNER
jgi:hypothetical protein